MPSIGSPPTDVGTVSSQVSARLSDPRLMMSTSLSTFGGGAITPSSRARAGSSSDRGQGLAPNIGAGSVGDGARAVPGGDARQGVSGLFQIPPSQDVFAAGGSHDLSIGFESQSGEIRN